MKHDKKKEIVKKMKVHHENHHMSFDRTTKRGVAHLKATKDARGREISQETRDNKMPRTKDFAPEYGHHPVTKK